MMLAVVITKVRQATLLHFWSVFSSWVKTLLTQFTSHAA